MSKETKDHTRETAAPDAPAPGWHHGLTPEQIQKIENARHDDTEGVPPPVQSPPEQPEEPSAQAKADAKAKKEVEAEAEKKRSGKHG